MLYTAIYCYTLNYTVYTTNTTIPLQVMSLLICCTGIVLVSLFSAPDQADIKPNTTFTDNLVDVHPDAVEEGKNRGSVLGYIVSISSLSFYTF